MAGLFQFFARDHGGNGLVRRPSYSLPKLQMLHDRLQKILKTESADSSSEASRSHDEAVEVIREMTEALLWGEQNDENDQFFDFFCENCILADFVQILGRNVPKNVKVQLLQSLSMLIQNIRRQTSLYYLFSNNYVNQLILTEFDWSDEEILGYYISFLKSLALRLNPETVKFFFNERSQQFPLFTEALRFFSHYDQMVRTSVRNMTLRVFSLQDEAVQSFVLRVARPYFHRLSEYLVSLCFRLDAVARSAGSSAASIGEAEAEQQDLLMYIGDVLELNNQQLNVIVVRQFLEHACYPYLLHTLTLEQPEGLSVCSVLFLLHEIFQTLRRSDVAVPLASALLSDGAGSGSPSPKAAPEIKEVWEPFKAEDPQEAPHVALPPMALRRRMLQLLRAEGSEALLCAGVLRACLALGISNVLPEELLVEVGLLPPLDVLLAATQALEKLSSLNLLVVQGLCRLCMDLAFTPQARSACARSSWLEPAQRSARDALRNAARQVRSFIHTLGDAFLDIFANAWDLDHESPMLPELCKAQLSLMAEAEAAGDSQQAFKAVRVMLLLRRLHSDLASGGGSPRRAGGGYAGHADGPEGPGFIIDSALTPLSGWESPLSNPEEHFECAVGESFPLKQRDRVVCGIVTPEGRHTRYFLFNDHLFLLVKPSLTTKELGNGELTHLVPLRHLEIEASDRQLSLKRPAQVGESAEITLTFEGPERCRLARVHLVERRQQVRKDLCKKILDFVSELCD